MSCPRCSSVSQEEFPAELMFHFRGAQNLDRPGVMIFPKVLVCLKCGFSQFTAPIQEVALLAQAAPSSRS
jgi:hypothetical protein